MASASVRLGSEERRAAPRRRTLLRGKLASPGLVMTGDCVIRDVSETGARISTPHEELAERAPCLVVVRDGVAHETQTAWLRDGQAGLHFLASHDLKHPLPEHIRPLRRLWVELLPR